MPELPSVSSRDVRTVLTGALAHPGNSHKWRFLAVPIAAEPLGPTQCHHDRRTRKVLPRASIKGPVSYSPKVEGTKCSLCDLRGCASHISYRACEVTAHSIGWLASRELLSASSSPFLQSAAPRGCTAPLYEKNSAALGECPALGESRSHAHAGAQDSCQLHHLR